MKNKNYGVKSGKMQSVKLGRNYTVFSRQKDSFLGGVLTDEQKEEIKLSIKKTMKDYGETIRLLGNE